MSTVEKALEVVKKINNAIETNHLSEYISIFSNQITNAVTNLTNVDELVEQLNEFKTLLDKAKVELDADASFRQEYKFTSEPNADKTKYTELVDAYRSKLNSKNLSVAIIKEFLDQLMPVKDKIKGDSAILSKAIEHINSLPQLFSEQKQLFIQKLNALNPVSQENTNRVLSDANNLNERSFVSTLDSLKNLNYNQQLDLNTWKNNIDINQLTEKVNKFVQTNELMGQLTNLINAFDNYSSLSGYMQMPQDEKTDFINSYNKAKEAKDNQVNYDEIKPLYDKLETFKKILNQEFYQNVQAELEKVKNSSSLYLYQKNVLEAKLRSAFDQSKLDQIKTEVEQAITQNQPHNDLQTFNNLSEAQKRTAQDALAKASTLAEYNQQKQKFTDLNAQIATSKSVYQQYSDYRNQQYYIQNERAVKTEVYNAYTELNKAIENVNATASLLQEKQSTLMATIEKAKVESEKFKQKEELKQVKKNFDNLASQINDLINKHNATIAYAKFYEPYLNSVKQKVENAKSAFSDSDLNKDKELVATLTTLKNQIDPEIEKINAEVKKQQQEDLQRQQEQRTFENHYNNVIYSISNKNKLPSAVVIGDLTLLNNDTTNVSVSDVYLTPNDENGTLELQFKVSYKGMSRLKNQTINNFLTTAQVAAQQELQNALNIYNSSVASLENLRASVSSLGSQYQSVVDQINRDLSSNRLNNNNNLEEIKQKTETIQQAIVNDENLKNQIDQQIKQQQELQEQKRQLISGINSLKDRFNAFKENPDVANLIQSLQNKLSPLTQQALEAKNNDDLRQLLDNLNNEFTQIQEQYQTQIETNFNNKKQQLMFLVENKQVLPSEIQIAQISNNASTLGLEVNIQQILPNDQEGTLQVYYSIAYKNLLENQNNTITGFLNLNQISLNDLKAKQQKLLSDLNSFKSQLMDMKYDDLINKVNSTLNDDSVNEFDSEQIIKNKIQDLNSKIEEYAQLKNQIDNAPMPMPIPEGPENEVPSEPENPRDDRPSDEPVNPEPQPDPNPEVQPQPNPDPAPQPQPEPDVEPTPTPEEPKPAPAEETVLNYNQVQDLITKTKELYNKVDGKVQDQLVQDIEKISNELQDIMDNKNNNNTQAIIDAKFKLLQQRYLTAQQEANTQLKDNQNASKPYYLLSLLLIPVIAIPLFIWFIIKKRKRS
ncbi:lipoprotein 17-related variable surface protein [Mycoplasma nasistruthionis]|uniref:Lipoprotein-associated type-17 domain-containing protein n=1 Tax=Mycoplasma nasistruthionis TaxID=353852 RepID=A0A4Y6I5B7_9MOLU|nr:lipoprotein 17-related variable surface protein [Mycoplasma nasistruthionis]QDF64805.1 hypothetical protein FIV53_00540 [Mycoplasma nasistruthionis]